MRIGLFTPSYPGINGEGGIGTYTRSLAHALSDRGHGVHVLTPGCFPDGSMDGPVAAHPTRKDHFRGLDRILPGAGASHRIGASMKRMVRRHGLDIVDFPNWEGFGLGYAWRRPAPLLVRISTPSSVTNAIDGTSPPRIAAWDVRRENLLIRSADRLVTHSDAHRRLIAGDLAIEPGRIAVVPLAVPVFPHFQRPASPPGGPLVVFLGRMEKRKGTRDLIDSVPGVLRAVPDARFLFIGDDRPHCPGGRNHAEYIRDEIPAEARASITLAGRLPDGEVDHHLQSADLFVAPSLYESFGVIYLEAMRWGTPVIGTTAGGIPEIVQDGETGLLVPPGDRHKLTATIVTALRDVGLRRRLGEAGRKKVESHFTTERMARLDTEIYEQVIEKWRSRRSRTARQARDLEPIGP